MGRRKKKGGLAPFQGHKLIVDASAFIALYDPSDSFHKAAIDFRDSFILNYRVELFTTNYVLSEALSHLTGLGQDKLKSLINEIRNPRELTLRITELWVGPETIEKALPIFYQYMAHDFSITDCTSFVLMEEHDIKCAFTFDSDFIIYTGSKGKFWKLPEHYPYYLLYCRDAGLI